MFFVVENAKILNIQFLCPNCHSQTNNYKGKGRKNGQSEGES